MDQSSPSAAQEAAPAVPVPSGLPVHLARFRFTSETARRAGLASVEATRKRRLGNAAGDPGTQAEPGAQRKHNGISTDPASFVGRRLERVRRQLDRVDAMLAEETDPARIDKLCAASSKLEEQERRLSDRSLPPVRRAHDQAPAKLGHGSSLFAAGHDEQ